MDGREGGKRAPFLAGEILFGQEGERDGKGDEQYERDQDGQVVKKGLVSHGASFLVFYL